MVAVVVPLEISKWTAVKAKSVVKESVSLDTGKQTPGHPRRAHWLSLGHCLISAVLIIFLTLSRSDFSSEL